MYYHLSDHIYVSQFRDDFICLDTIEDKYTIGSTEFSCLLGKLLEGTPPPLSLQESSLLQRMIDKKIIKNGDYPYPFFIDKKPESEGVSNVDWRLPLDVKKTPFNFQVLKALSTLIKVNFFIKIKGFYKTIQLIKYARHLNQTYQIPQKEGLKNLANIVNKACLLYPTRTKCLEWSITFILLALKRNWKCNLEIGVQNYPFFAHAWVECNGEVVMDSQELRQGLSIILNEPFRKLRS